jgi:3D (Asp-Asp-Asp) domain-containing protein
MKRLLIISVITVLGLPAASAVAREQTILARITVYWPNGSEPGRASSNGAKLRIGHCAVDPKKIPYGSKVIFADTACTAIDSGPAVIKRTAARKCGRTTEQRNALVIDRYFETKRQALAWAAANPHFMRVRVTDPHHAVPEEKGPAAHPKPGAEFADTKATKTQSQNASLAPADVRGPLIPTFFGSALPRS